MRFLQRSCARTASFLARLGRSGFLSLTVLAAAASSGCASPDGAPIGTARSRIVALDGSAQTAMTAFITAPSAACVKQGMAPTGLSCAATGTCDTLSANLPVLPPLTCLPRPYASTLVEKTARLVGGCGVVGILETFHSAYTGDFWSKERWFDPASGALVGVAADSKGVGLTCQGALPPTACAMTACNPCEPPRPENGNRQNCNLRDVGVTGAAP